MTRSVGALPPLKHMPPQQHVENLMALDKDKVVSLFMIYLFGKGKG